MLIRQILFLIFCHLSMWHHHASAHSGESGIELYASKNYTDLLYKISTNRTSNCNNFPSENGILNVGSINTTGQCWVLYGDPDCQSQLFSERITTNVSWEKNHEIGSFQLCAEEIERTSSLHVDLTTFYGDLDQVPNTLEAYENICGCHNIPEYILNLDKWSVNNYGNDMVAYFEKNCGEEKFKPLNIPAGYSTKSRDIYKYERTDADQIINQPTYKAQVANGNPDGKIYRIQSFGPDLNSIYFRKNCVKFDGTVVKFEIDDRAEFEENDLHIDMFNNVFRNDGHNGMSRTYFISKVVEERFHVEVDSSLETLSRILVDVDFEVESNFDQNVFKEQAIREVLRKAYSNTSNSKNTELNSFKTFSVKQVMNIPPCTEHKLSAHVTMLRNDGIQFRALMKISGNIGGREMVAGELKRFMDKGMEYKGDFDGNTVFAYAKGTVGMEFGTSVVIEGEDIAIPECVNYHHLLTCPACEVCY